MSGDKRNLQKNRRMFFWLIVAALMILSFEAVSWIFFDFYGKERFVYHAKVNDQYFKNIILNNHSKERASYLSNNILGWDEKGVKLDLGKGGGIVSVSRRTPYKSKTYTISTYGDSFTYCQDVTDDQTWQYYLSELTDSKVLNYGVRGFGTDQAVLKLIGALKKRLVTDVIILGILSENIARVVNVSPKYYWSAGNVTAFKPILIKNSNGYEWKTEYLKTLNSPKGKLEAIRATRMYDYWYQINRYRPSFKFPYSVSLLDTLYYFAFKVKRWPDLWKEERPKDVMRKIIGIFYSLSEEYDFTPVVLFIPDNYDLRLKDKGKHASYSDFLIELESAYKSRKLIVVDAIKGEFDSFKYNVKPYQGHASAYGNRQIAKAVNGGLNGAMNRQ